MQRSLARLYTLQAKRACSGFPEAPWNIVVERIGRNDLDDDNLAASAKHIRDGVADALGIDDGDQASARWSYRQSRGPFGARVRFEPRGE